MLTFMFRHHYHQHFHFPLKSGEERRQKSVVEKLKSSKSSLLDTRLQDSKSDEIISEKNAYPVGIVDWWTQMHYNIRCMSDVKSGITVLA